MKIRFAVVIGISLLLFGLGSCRSALGIANEQAFYAVTVSASTLSDPGWKTVVTELAEKYQAPVLVWRESPVEIQPDLAALMPRYTCFVVRPEEPGHALTVTVSRMTRALDDDPWTDTFWGFLTGYTYEDARRIIAESDPLWITRALDATGKVDLLPFDEARCYDEFTRGKMKIKRGETLEVLSCPEDNTAGVVEALVENRVQLVATSAHADQHSWTMGYRGPNLVMRHKEGVLTVTDTAGVISDLHCPEPKVVIAAGNCLIGDVTGKDCMVTSWIHSGGAHQFVGYTVPTWFGFMGWGALSLFTETPGQYSLTEAFHFNNIRNVMRLRSEYPLFAEINLMNYTMDKLPDVSYWQLGAGMNEEVNRLGLLFDRDVVAFYGDPAWSARIRPFPKPAFTLSRQQAEDEPKAGGTWIVRTQTDGKWPESGLFIPLSYRIADWEIIENGTGVVPLFADNFIHLPLQGTFKAGAEMKLTYRAVFAQNMVQKARLTDIQTLVKFFDDAVTATRPDSPAAFARKEMAALRCALARSGKNITALTRAFQLCSNDEIRLELLYSVIYARSYDLQTLPARYWVDNVTYALKAWKESPWKEQVSLELFRHYILPFSLLDERADNWRPLFYDRFAARAFLCKTPGEAVAMLNKIVFKELDVTYHATKRPKPNQSPLESIEAKFASCTGLSVILADACRAVGIPSRIVGCPLWTDRSGNHNWVEFWENQWVYEGASHSDLRNRDWVGDKVKQFTDRTRWEHSVMATAPAPQPGGRAFQMVWMPLDQSVPAIPVTDFYTDESQEKIQLPGAGKVLWIYAHGEPIYRLTGEGEKSIFLPRTHGEKNGKDYEFIVLPE